MKHKDYYKVQFLWTFCVLIKFGEMVLTNTTEGISFSLELPPLGESKSYCAYLTCIQSNRPEINVINGIKIFDIVANGSEVASMSLYTTYVLRDGFGLIDKKLTNGQANMVVSVGEQENCNYGEYMCIVDYTRQNGSRRTNSAIVRSEAVEKSSCLDVKALFEWQEQMSTKMSKFEAMLKRIETKVNVVNTTFELVSKVLEDYHLLDTPKSDWILAFRGTPFVDKSVYKAYLDGTGIPYTIEIGCKTVNSSLPCYNHYRNNSILDNWTNIKEVKFAIYQNNVQVHYVILDGQGSNYMNWLEQRRILSSSWSDIKWKTINGFGIEGYASAARKFIMNQAYPPQGCPADIGWFVALEKGGCPYEASSFYPLFKFAKGNEATEYQGPNIGVADMFAIFVKKD